MAIMTKDKKRSPATVFFGSDGGRKEETGESVFVQHLTPDQMQLDLLIKLMICGAIAAVVIAAGINFDRLEATREEMNREAWGSWYLLLGEIFLGISLSAILWRLYLVWRYRPAPTCPDDQLPVCTVVVPAYNEGRQVLMTLKSLAASDYPAGKLKIIAVDDGSVDDTWQWIQAAKKELTGRIMTLKLPSNRGKRHALHAGFQNSIGDVLVTVDSDSVVDSCTIRRLVSPLIQDRRVGAVAGNVRVLNRNEGIIARMLEVTFLFSFDFIRASQSMVDTVMCTPGALSAYRRQVVMPLLEEWLGQTFFGSPANIGEDRAMTNLILRQGHFVRFQQNAMVYTNVPVHYKNLCRMFLRWARSNIRESIVMSRFAFRRFRNSSMLGARINLILQLLSLTKSQVLLAATLVSFAWRPSQFGINIMVGIVIGSTLPAAVYALHRRDSDCLLGYLYGAFWLLCLSWITPFALMTPHRSGWLTRRISTADKKPVADPQTVFPDLQNLPVKITASHCIDPAYIGIVNPYMLAQTCKHSGAANVSVLLHGPRKLPF